MVTMQFKKHQQQQQKNSSVYVEINIKLKQSSPLKKTMKDTKKSNAGELQDSTVN